MKAALLVGPTRVEVREVPDPEVPEDGVVLQTRACGICGSDLRRWREGPPAGVEGLIQGHELAGTVMAVGNAVRGCAVGERLAVAPDIHCGECYYCRRGWFNLCADLRLLGITPGYPGGFAEQVALRGDVLRLGIVHRMPPEATFHEGALAETLSSVLASHAKAGTTLGDTVVVLGAGPIGCLHTAVARARGARVIVVEPHPRRRESAQRFGPERTLDPAAVELVAEVRRLTQGIGADVVICANPVASTQTQAVEMVRRGGSVVLFGGLPKKDPMTRLDGNLIHYGEVAVVGAFSYHPRFHEDALALLACKQVDATALVTHVMPLEKIAEAFEIAQAGDALKVMVEPVSRV